MSEDGKAADKTFKTSDAAAARGCDRAEEFVAYLYGESTPEGAENFRRHLEACAVCREELAALGGVREDLGVWRAEALGALPSLDIGRAFAAPAGTRAPADGLRRTPERKRSAAAALREFFSLAPLWLRAGAFAATLAVCALAALTLARSEVRWDAGGLAFRAGVTERIVREQPAAPAPPAPAQNLYTEEQLRAAVAREVAEATARLREERQERQERREQPERIVNASAGDVKPRPRAAGPSSQRRGRAAQSGARRGESLLAEDNLPRLSDLLDGSYED
ncbi:MAG TPA: zf-HC2 domain-containing protein [Pyrinomonadaceae bacterium]|jgi:hypothetical protein